MDSLFALYPAHLHQLNQMIQTLLNRDALDGVLIYSGHAPDFFCDDQGHPFKLNPYFNYWVPLNLPACWLYVDGQRKPRLMIQQSYDFWHQPFDVASMPWANYFDWVYVAQEEDVIQWLTQQKTYAYLGEDQTLGRAVNAKTINDASLLHFLNYHRGFKTEYEVACLSAASLQALQGHQAIETKIKTTPCASEFDLHMAYLKATSQEGFEQPYPAIIAHNQHAAILHYQHKMRKAPQTPLSLLVDAGASCQGYASDISRTYAFDQGLFSEMVSALDVAQQAMINRMQIGQSFHTLQQQACYDIAQLLSSFGLVSGSAESLVEQGVVKAFFPHGLGHLLGLQVHDVGDGLLSPYLEDVAKLTPQEQRLKRLLAPQQVMTIEPGIYFIEQLLKPLKSTTANAQCHWATIEALMPYGGIRIEDNVLVKANGIENLTRLQHHPFAHIQKDSSLKVNPIEIKLCKKSYLKNGRFVDLLIFLFQCYRRLWSL